VPQAARPKRAHKPRPQDPRSLDPIIESIQIKLSVIDLLLEEAATPEADPLLRSQRLDYYRNLTHAHKRECWPLLLAPPCRTLRVAALCLSFAVDASGAPWLAAVVPAALALSPSFVPVDAAVIGIVDHAS
jgi:hypothetical protein